MLLCHGGEKIVVGSVEGGYCWYVGFDAVQKPCLPVKCILSWCGRPIDTAATRERWITGSLRAEFENAVKYRLLI